MKKSQRLQPVLQLAARKKQQAEQQLGQARQQLQAEQQKLIQLEAYREEYQQSILGLGRGGTQIEQLRRMQAFLARLSEAIDQQGQQIVMAEQVVAQATKAWQVAHGRHQAMDSLIERSRDAEQRQEDKQFQKTIDELSQNRRSRDT
ncbi:flagellar export protein FliJ [Motiliproteus sp. SC1-56]|uniref:flagellar export protein FliJ n=1 Tax=Motiliproteus sp. SC1-56 TaxID=2799565 RepID=UPI001A8E2A59|nr:flagellar export protein FliJ [Motiliproteus sp. SC1-56]